MEVDALIISNTPSVTAQGLGTKEGAAKYVRHLNHTTPILFLYSSLPFMVTQRVMATDIEILTTTQKSVRRQHQHLPVRTI